MHYEGVRGGEQRKISNAERAESEAESAETRAKPAEPRYFEQITE